MGLLLLLLFLCGQGPRHETPIISSNGFAVEKCGGGEKEEKEKSMWYSRNVGKRLYRRRRPVGLSSSFLFEEVIEGTFAGKKASSEALKGSKPSCKHWKWRRDSVEGETVVGLPQHFPSRGPVWRTCSSFSLPLGNVLHSTINIYPDWCSDRETTIRPVTTVWELEQKKGRGNGSI